jgi:hypothetical protein
VAKKWFDRAAASYRVGDLEDANTAIENALRSTPDREDVRLLAAKIALANLEYERVGELLQGVNGAEARGLRGRAYWYAGELDKAADELEALLSDPDVRDPWAKDIAKLARRGAGRAPFKVSGALLAVTEMPHVGSTALIVPLEVNGEPALALIATNVPEAVLDSSSGATPAWISLRFGERLEMRDVPALAQDLSGLSRSVNAPIKALLGTHVLRKLNATLDFGGRQFVVRSFEAPPPPDATSVRVGYVRGGGMVVQAGVSASREASPLGFLVDTSLVFPVALDEGGWKSAGVAQSELKPVQGAPGIKQGLLPMLRLGAFEIPRVPAVQTSGIREMEESLGLDLAGLIGSGMLAEFRVTFADRGRALWLEDAPSMSLVSEVPPSEEPAEPLPEGAPNLEAPAPAPLRPGAGPGVVPGARPPTLLPPGSRRLTPKTPELKGPNAPAQPGGGAVNAPGE